MTLEILPVWPIVPDWSSALIQTLEWKTDILTSPTGAEQRRALRRYPRRYLEFDVLMAGRERALADNLITAHGARDWYLPLWHDTHLLATDAAVGSSSLSITTAAKGWFVEGGAAFIGGDDPFAYELVEVGGIGSSSLQLAGPLATSWSAGTRIFPAVKARIASDQPDFQRKTDELATGNAKWLISQAQAFAGADPSTGLVYRGYSVLTLPPDESSQLPVSFERIVEEMDNDSCIPLRVDTANRAFMSQKHTWLLEGRDEHLTFERFVYGLRGRAVPTWFPTFSNDFDLAASAASGSVSLVVNGCGYFDSGGPRPDRKDVRILLTDGTIICRRITAVAIAGNNEVLALDSPLPRAVALSDVSQISFMALMRLNQDSLEIVHETDVEGASRVSTTFRSAPDIQYSEAIFP